MLVARWVARAAAMSIGYVCLMIDTVNKYLQNASMNHVYFFVVMQLPYSSLVTLQHRIMPNIRECIKPIGCINSALARYNVLVSSAAMHHAIC